jgi:hypothetical protein
MIRAQRSIVTMLLCAACTAGDRARLHASAALMAGTLQGSGHNGLVAMPVLSCGYGVVNLEAAPMGFDAMGAWLRVSIPLR